MDNQERLLDIALMLFSQRGYDAVSVREVVEEAGVTKPTLYHYFDSKRGLLEALLKREEGRLLSSLLQAAVYKRDIVYTLEKIARAYFGASKSHPDFYRMQIAMLFSPPQSDSHLAMLPFVNHQYEIMEEVFIQAAQDHGNLRGRHKRYASGFLGTINAMIGLSLEGELDLTEEVVYLTVHQFLHGIFS